MCWPLSNMYASGRTSVSDRTIGLLLVAGGPVFVNGMSSGMISEGSLIVLSRTKVTSNVGAAAVVEAWLSTDVRIFSMSVDTSCSCSTSLLHRISRFCSAVVWIFSFVCISSTFCKH